MLVWRTGSGERCRAAATVELAGWVVCTVSSMRAWPRSVQLHRSTWTDSAGCRSRLNHWSQLAVWRSAGARYTVACPARALADAFVHLSSKTWVGSLAVAEAGLMLAERQLQIPVTSGIRPKPARLASPKLPDARTELLRVLRLRSGRSWPPGLGQKRLFNDGRCAEAQRGATSGTARWP